MVELRISDKVCQLLGIVPTRICSKLIGSALVFGFGFIVGASVLVLTATIFMFSSFSSSGMNPLLQNDVNRYHHHHHESSVLHCSSETPSPPPASPPTLSTPSMSPSFPPSPLPASPSPLPPPRASPSPLPSPPNNPSPSPLSPPLSFPETLENSTEENQTGRNSYYNSSDNLPEVKSVDAKVDLLNTIAPTFSSDTRNVSFGDDSESSDGDCDMYDGEWVRVVNREPYYSLGSCPFIEKQPFDCYSNGKRDNDYLNWQWQWNSTPTNTGCKNKTSIFDGTDFLMRLRGKKLVFSGDSINRNMYESLVCMLWSVVPDKSRIVTPSLYSEYKTRGDLSLIFEDYNCTVAFVWSPFLVNETNSKTRRRRRGELKPEPETLRLDQIDGFSSSVYQDADIVVFDSYHWWVQEKTNYGINYFQEGDYLYPKLDINRAYRRALMSWRRWIDNNIDSTKTQVVFRGFSLSHYGGGRWNTGGKCSLEAEPITSKEKYINPDQSQVTILEDTLQKMKTPVIYLNVSKLTYYRSDAHPSLYAKNYTAKERSEASLIQDCSHWCLPGVPDTWNELLYNSLLKAGKGSFGGR